MNADNKEDITLLSDFSAQKTQLKIIKLICNFTSIIAFFYALYFWLIIEQPFIAVINGMFILAYMASLIMIKYKYPKVATLWFFGVLASHVLILTTQIFTPETGFHYYYLLFPTAVFLLLEDKEKLAKAIIIVTGTVLFFVCQHFEHDPLIKLSRHVETWMFSSTIVVIVLELAVVMFIFSHMITSRENKLKEMASLDPLTSVNNRRRFMQVAKGVHSQSMQDGKTFCLLLMDIDYFKKINDIHGHQAGDKALMLVASLLKVKIRKNDILARYGGEEFILLLPNTNLNKANELAESIRLSVEALNIPLSSHSNISCTISLGIAQNDTNLIDLSSIVNQADKALYRAKIQGRNCICY